MARKVSLFFDVEDPFGEHADDAALDVAHVFATCGVRGTFCVTGKKCRKLVERGRSDVLAALEAHALGLHTNTHSVHPTTMELLADTDWLDGVEAAIEAEKTGLDSFRKAFRRMPCCWAGAGYTWGPQIAEALDRLRIPGYVYALTSVGHGRVHRFLNSLAFPISAVARETEYEEDAKTNEAIARVTSALARSESDWPIVFCGHPTRMRYSDYWDRPYYAGVNPDPYVGVPAKPARLYERSLRNLEHFISSLAADFEIVGLDEAVGQPWRFANLTSQELEIAMAETKANIQGRAKGWPVHRPDLNTERLEGETLRRLDSLRIATL